MGAQRGTREERFWRFVRKRESCWEWTGAKTGAGYGQLRTGGITENAHRIAWEIANNKPVPSGLFVCHHCDNRSCVRPEHLFVGTCKENAEDMMRKGRHVIGIGPRGSEVAVSKLTTEDVLEIRRLCEARVSQPATAKKFGVSTTVINNIAHRKAWAWL